MWLFIFIKEIGWASIPSDLGSLWKNETGYRTYSRVGWGYAVPLQSLLAEKLAVANILLAYNNKNPTIDNRYEQ